MGGGRAGERGTGGVMILCKRADIHISGYRVCYRGLRENACVHCCPVLTPVLCVMGGIIRFGIGPRRDAKSASLLNPKPQRYLFLSFAADLMKGPSSSSAASTACLQVARALFFVSHATPLPPGCVGGRRARADPCHCS